MLISRYIHTLNIYTSNPSATAHQSQIEGFRMESHIEPVTNLFGSHFRSSRSWWLQASAESWTREFVAVTETTSLNLRHKNGDVHLNIKDRLLFLSGVERLHRAHLFDVERRSSQLHREGRRWLHLQKKIQAWASQFELNETTRVIGSDQHSPPAEHFSCLCCASYF